MFLGNVARGSNVGDLERKKKKEFMFPKHLNLSYDLHVYSNIQKFPGSPSEVVTDSLGVGNDS